MKSIQQIVRELLPGEGQLATMLKSGDLIRIENIHMTPHGPQATVRRAHLKVKGKAARRAEKAARRARRFL